MGWGNIRHEVHKRQQGLCGVCHEPVSASSGVLHHIKNKSQGGQYTAENAELRHLACEKWAHATYKYGNPDKGVEIDYPKKRERHDRYPFKSRRISKSEKLARTLVWIEENCREISHDSSCAIPLSHR